MKYFKNGSNLDTPQPRQFAYSCEGQVWSYLSKDKVREISGYGSTVRLQFDNGQYLEIPLHKLEQPEAWKHPDNSNALEEAMADISSWLDETGEVPNTDLADLKKYQLGANGFQIIQASQGPQAGNWYLIKTLEDTLFSSLQDNGVQMVGIRMPTNLVLPDCTMLTTANLDGNGFTQFQLTSGSVIAYRK